MANASKSLPIAGLHRDVVLSLFWQFNAFILSLCEVCLNKTSSFFVCTGFCLYSNKYSNCSTKLHLLLWENHLMSLLHKIHNAILRVFYNGRQCWWLNNTKYPRTFFELRWLRSSITALRACVGYIVIIAVEMMSAWRWTWTVMIQWAASGSGRREKQETPNVTGTN